MSGRRAAVLAVSPPERWLPLPLAASLAHAAASPASESFDFLPLTTWRGRDLIQHAHDRPGSIYLFSDYLWSVQRNLTLSTSIRAADPSAVIIHGGASVPRQPSEATAFCRATPAIDILVLGEGEATLADILVAISDRGRRSDALRTPGTFAMVGDEAVLGAQREQVADLGSLASPYLDGWLEMLVGPKFGATIESDRGCPYGCSFCDWGAATLSRVRYRPIEVVRAEIEWLARRGVGRVEVANANFGAMDRDIDIAVAIANAHRRWGSMGEVGMNFPKNDASRSIEILRILVDAGVRPHAKAALQTTAPEPLRLARRRNLPVSELRALNDAAVKLDLPIGTDIMIGLPGATVADVARDLAFCMAEDLPASTTPVVLLPNSPMNDTEFRRANQLVTNERGWLVATSTYSKDDFTLMQRMARVYNWAEGRQILRVLARFLHDEAGVPFEDFLTTLATADLGSPGSFLTSIDGEGFPSTPEVWSDFQTRVINALLTARVLVEPVDWQTLTAVLVAQRALMPLADGPATRRIELDHDLVRWWTSRSTPQAARVRDLEPGVLLVTDPHDLASQIAHGVVGVLYTDELERPPVLHSAFSRRSPTWRRTHRTSTPFATRFDQS